MAEGDNEKEFYPKLCASTLFFTILRLRKKKTGSQDICFKDFLTVVDPDAVSRYATDATLKKYASWCRNADELLPLDGEYVRFGDKGVCDSFRNEMKSKPQNVIERVRTFTDKYFDEESKFKLIRVLMDLVEKDKSIDEHGRSLNVNPNFIPSYKDEILSGDSKIYFYNFLIGIWFYVYSYSKDPTEGKETIEHWTEQSDKYSSNKARADLDDNLGYDGIQISYETEVIYNEEIKKEEFQKNPTRLVLPDGIIPDLATFDPESDEGVLVVQPVNVEEKISDKFSEYVDGALGNYTYKKGFLDTRERKFREFYVCSDVKSRTRKPISFITDNADFATRKEKVEVSDIKVDDLEKNFCVFVGIGGLGKSMLLQKILLDEAEVYQPGQRVPIMITLRSYKPDSKSLEFLLLTELRRFDPSLQLVDLYYLLDSGRAVCLLDGFDEVKKEYIHDFQDELDVLKDSRKKSYFILSSRDIPEVNTLNRPFIYELQNLSLKQACDLIRFLDPDRVDDELKEDFIDKLQRDVFHFNRDEKRTFVGNPLFLCLMIRTYDMIHDVPKERYVFYEKTYIAMASEYDSKTKRMTRPFFTGLNEQTFKKYLAEFCALTYHSAMYEFEESTMLSVFEQVVEDNGLNIDPELFIKDVTEKLCLIYKDGDVYEFIHRSFQEYFTAVYLLSLLSTDKSTVQDIVKELDKKIRKDETLSMMYGMDNKSFEMHLILPFLDEMFSESTDQENYEKYLLTYYPRIEYVTGDLDEDMCNNADQESAMFWLVKKQYNIDYGLLSSTFDFAEMYADDYEQYFWLEESWFNPDAHMGSMRLVQRNEIPSCVYNAQGVEVADDIDCDQGYLCGIDVEEWVKHGVPGDMTYDIIMQKEFPLRKEFVEFKNLYERLKNEYSNVPKSKFGLRRK